MDYMKRHRVPGIEGIDTRALTKHIRTAGAMRAALSSRITNPDDLVDKAREWLGLVGRDMVRRVTCKEAFAWRSDQVPGDSWGRRLSLEPEVTRGTYRVIAVDFGIKFFELTETANRVWIKTKCRQQINEIELKLKRCSSKEP